MCEGNMQRTHRAHYHHSRTIEMTSGSLWKNILLFSIPLVLTQLLEVLFNLSDVAVAGKFADYRALGAVGSTTQLVTLFTGFLIGLGSGVNVEVARSGGKVAGDARKAIEQQTGVPVITSKNAAQLNQVVTNLIEATDEIASKDKSKE